MLRKALSYVEVIEGEALRVCTDATHTAVKALHAWLVVSFRNAMRPDSTGEAVIQSIACVVAASYVSLRGIVDNDAIIGAC